MTLRFDFEWINQAPEGAAFGPELDTWCRVAISLNGEIVTANHPAPLSGIVEWIVEVWPHLLWEIHCPFPKTPTLGARVRIPTERDAAALWSDVRATSLRDVAVWQHRHTLGHGTADLALPSIVLLPEEKRFGVVLDHIPAKLDPTVRFTAPDGLQWPSEPVWIAREDAISELSRVVDETIARVKSRPNHGWAVFIEDRWAASRRAATDPNVRRALALGKIVADEWALAERRLNGDSAGMESLLLDSETISDKAEFQLLLDVATRIPAKPTATNFQPAPKVGRPYEQGYALAAEVRSYLGNESGPIIELYRTIVERFGINFEQPRTRAFASACFARESGGAMIALSAQQAEWGVAPSRFAVAAALGRLLGERIAGKPFGAAHSGQSRWINTQKANAFAAELLLPAKAFTTSADVSGLCDAYGISRSAAEWHLHNRQRV